MVSKVLWLVVAEKRCHLSFTLSARPSGRLALDSE